MLHRLDFLFPRIQSKEEALLLPPVAKEDNGILFRFFFEMNLYDHVFAENSCLFILSVEDTPEARVYPGSASSYAPVTGP